jgi:large subunit ribosomal protein L20
MTRVKRGSVARKRRNKILKSMKGTRGSQSILFRIANQQSRKAALYSYVDRRNRKRVFRSLWIRRINASLRSEKCSENKNQLNYSKFIHRLKISKLKLNRKTLSQLAILDPISFQEIVTKVTLGSRLV